MLEGCGFYVFMLFIIFLLVILSPILVPLFLIGLVTCCIGLPVILFLVGFFCVLYRCVMGK